MERIPQRGTKSGSQNATITPLEHWCVMLRTPRAPRAERYPGTALGLLGLLAVACGDRILVQDEAANEPEERFELPSPLSADRCPTGVDPSLWRVSEAQLGGYHVVVRAGDALEKIPSRSEGPLFEALLIDRKEVKAFVLARPLSAKLATLRPLEWVTEMRRWVESRYPELRISMRTAGVLGPATREQRSLHDVAWEVSHLEGGQTATELRARVLGAMADVTLTPKAGANAASPAANRHLIRLNLRQRGNWLVINGAIAVLAAQTDSANTSWADLAELADGTNLLPAGYSIEGACDAFQTRASATADLIWVIDESASMTDNRQNLVDQAGDFFQQATARGLGLRVGVTGMTNPKEGGEPGKLCSAEVAEKNGDGGADRFLSAWDQVQLGACIGNPPFYEWVKEFGLTGGYEAIKRHLPVNGSNLATIRPDAHLALVFVSDEAPFELKPGGSFAGQPGVLSPMETNPETCSLTTSSQEAISVMLAPWFELVNDPSRIEKGASVHTIGGLCGSRCSAEVSHGYQDLSLALGGHIAELCQTDLGPTLHAILDRIAALSSRYRLSQKPVSATLRVQVNGLDLPRSRGQGYSYDVATNTISLHNVPVTDQDHLAISYSSGHRR
jgi:hypothetical protein